MDRHRHTIFHQAHRPPPGQTRWWGSLHGAAIALAIAEAATDHEGLALLVVNDTLEAERLSTELRTFLATDRSEATRVLHFPDWETLAYDSFSPHQDIISERLRILNQLSEAPKGVLVVPVMTLMHRLAPREFLLGHSLSLEVGQKFDLDVMSGRLTASAYKHVDTVFEHGEYAVRGAIMDIFPMGSPHPFRIDLFDDEVESLRSFDPDTQLSLDRVDAIELLPAREFPLDPAAISTFQDRWHQQFTSDPRACPVYQDVSHGLSPAGIEYYLPLFFDHLDTLFDYLPDDLLLIQLSDVERAAASFWQEVSDRHESLRYDVERPILNPSALFLTVEQLFAAFKRYPRVVASREPAAARAGSIDFPTEVLPDLSVNERGSHPLSKLTKYAAGTTRRILICAESTGRRELLLEMLARDGLRPDEHESWRQFVAGDSALAIMVAPLERGLVALDAGLALVSEPDLFADHVRQQRRRRDESTAAELMVRSLTELIVGAPVVHIDHGVGRYRGLQNLEVDGQVTEFLTLEYQEGSRLYVPVSSLHLISRYAGADEATAPLHRLGGDAWHKAKRRAAEKVFDVAAELLNIYARRAARKGFAFTEPDDSYHQFIRGFPFEETPDQQAAIENVITDMTGGGAMDRLICGDVGFGKTEVAMRAAFLAIESGRQVAMLVPTTLLAQQHYETFSDRFAGWPVTIDVVSRFRTRKEQQSITDRLLAGGIDIIIGTHALIQAGLDFKNLGLVIIDEEHRFGVRQKERLKSLRAEVDILTLTATPIPRTLNMAMSGMRDLSIIATPPAKRLSIKTFVRQRQDGLVKEAIQREIQRGGQVYYLHNEVRTIDNTADKLRRLLPEARISVGHGQMRERQLERVMSDFYHKRTNVLVCSTIIETGIDIPSANTIVIERADKFGLAQIHQLRGRVGRSHHQAYAYLLTPHPKAMTSDARKRLEAIVGAEELGSGFILATHDLEIRGAGEILGDDQTGHIHEVGFTLYMELLNRAVASIESGKLDQPLTATAEVNLRVPALIPDDYLPDVHLRLILYRRIANATNDEELRALQVEMIDRFGLLPEPLEMLFRSTSLKLKAEALGIRKIDLGPNGGRLEFSDDTPISPLGIVQLVQSEPHRYRLSNQNQLRIEENMEDTERRFNKAERLLARLEDTTRSTAGAAVSTTG